jgi:undecaprenyl-diphosphatase
MTQSPTPTNTPSSPVLPQYLALGCRSKRQILLLLSGIFVTGAICYLLLDKPLARWVETHSHYSADFWQIVTRIGLSQWYIVLSAALLLTYKFIIRDTILAWRSALVLCCVAGSGLFVSLFKWIFARYRPPMLFRESKFGFAFFEPGYMQHSFPSGHSATAAALVVLACLFMPRGRWLWIAMGLLVAASRIFVGAHYLSDVIAGWTAGILVSLLICRMLKPPSGLEP